MDLSRLAEEVRNAIDTFGEEDAYPALLADQYEGECNERAVAEGLFSLFNEARKGK